MKTENSVSIISQTHEKGCIKRKNNSVDNLVAANDKALDTSSITLKFREGLQKVDSLEKMMASLNAKRKENKQYISQLQKANMADTAAIEQKRIMCDRMLRDKDKLEEEIQFWSNLSGPSGASRSAESRVFEELLAQRRRLENEKSTLLSRERRNIADPGLFSELHEVESARHQVREERYELLNELAQYEARVPQFRPRDTCPAGDPTMPQTQTPPFPYPTWSLVDQNARNFMFSAGASTRARSVEIHGANRWQRVSEDNFSHLSSSAGTCRPSYKGKIKSFQDHANILGSGEDGQVARSILHRIISGSPSSNGTTNGIAEYGSCDSKLHLKPLTPVPPTAPKPEKMSMSVRRRIKSKIVL